MSQKGKLELAPHQVEHFSRVVRTLSWHPVYLDVSQMGAGKTVIALMLAAYYKLRLFVVAPAGNLDMWYRSATKYRIPLTFEHLFSYDKLRGTTRDGCNHGMLTMTRVTSDTSQCLGGLKSKRGKSKFAKMYEYHPTEQLKGLIREGTLFVFDEIQKIKNIDSESHAACHTIIKTMMEMREDAATQGVPFTSKAGLLSALPIDRYVEIGAVLKMLGIVRSKRYLVKMPGREFYQTGFKELTNFCSRIDHQTTLMLTKGRNITEKALPGYLADLYQKILKVHLSSSMPTVTARDNIDIKNGYYDVPLAERQQIEESYQQLLAATGYNSDLNPIGKRNQGQTIEALGKLELHKVNLFARLARQALAESPNNKVILYVWRTSRTPKILADKLKEFNPIVLTGETPIKDRPGLISQFQRPDSFRRLIIAHPIVGGIGHDLDDQDGRFPRYIFVSPNYNHNDLYQLTGRTCRHNTKSCTRIRFVYVRGYEKETSVLDNLATKSAEARVMLFEHDNTLPGQYMSDVEALVHR